MQVFTYNNNEVIVESIHKMLNSVDIKPDRYSIIDVASQIFEINDKNMIAFGKKAIMAVVTNLVRDGLIEKGSYIGKPLIDEDSGFFFYGIPIDISEIMKDDNNKYYVFEILQDLSSYYQKWNPFNDELNFTDISRDINGEINADSNSITMSDANNDSIGPKTTVLDSLELISKLIEKVDFSDTGLGKSLSKFEKIKLVTNNNMILNVLPISRETKNNDPMEIDITYKDLLSLLKIVILTGSRTVEFFKDIKQS